MVRWACRAGTGDFLFCLGCCNRPSKNIFSSPYTTVFQFILFPSPSKLGTGRQSCWVACFLLCVTGQSRGGRGTSSCKPSLILIVVSCPVTCSSFFQFNFVFCFVSPLWAVSHYIFPHSCSGCSGNSRPGSNHHAFDSWRIKITEAVQYFCPQCWVWSCIWSWAGKSIRIRIRLILTVQNPTRSGSSVSSTFSPSPLFSSLIHGSLRGELKPA